MLFKTGVGPDGNPPGPGPVSLRTACLAAIVRVRSGHIIPESESEAQDQEYLASHHDESNLLLDASFK